MKLFKRKKKPLKEKLLGTPEERLEGIEKLYKDMELRKRIEGKIRKMGGQLEDAKDAYQSSFFILQRHIVHGNYRGEGSPEDYLTGICIRRWKDLKRSAYKDKVVFVTDEAQMDGQNPESPSDPLLAEERKQLIDQLLEMVKERCREILWLRANDMSMQEIAQKVNLPSAQRAAKEAYLCSEKLRKMLMKDPKSLKLLKSYM